MDKDLVLADVQEAKRILRERGGTSCPGIDGLTYEMVQDMDDEELLALLNKCFREGVIPSAWRTALVAAIPKRGKDIINPELYRAVALESCVLKFASIILNLKFYRAAEELGAIPPSQGGFRPKFNTSDNMFILRTLADSADAGKHHLYVAFVDISNAFPSADHDILWSRMQKMGLTGRYFDWVRRLYASLVYRVQQENELSHEFKSMLGVLAGEPLSPTLWNLFLADFTLPERADDVRLMGQCFSHLEFADDMVITSTTPEGLQAHLHSLEVWCKRNRLSLNATKTEIMILRGPLPRGPRLPVFTLDGRQVKITDNFKYLGVNICSTEKDMFKPHYLAKTTAAKAAAWMIYRLEMTLGRHSVDPRLAKDLYMALVDCHLIHGADVSPDVDTNLVEGFSKVQVQTLRKILGLHKNSALDPLFTELGIICVRFRRLLVCLRYLGYLISLPGTRLARKALEAVQDLRENGHPSWLSDLDFAIRAATENTIYLPSDLRDISATKVAALSKKVNDYTLEEHHSAINTSNRLYLLRGRREPLRDGTFKVLRTTMRHYNVQVTVVDHRRSLIHLLTGNHIFRCLSWRQVDGSDLCRMCGECVESPEHAFIQCEGHLETTMARTLLLARASIEGIMVPQAPIANDDALQLLRALVFHWELVVPTAEFVHEVWLMWKVV